MMRIIVTGVGGNVGQYIGNDLAHAGHEVIGIYRNTSPQSADYKLVKADISGVTPPVFEDADTVIHIAANILGNTAALIRDNIEATKNLVCQAEREHVRRFVYMSSVAVYGRVNGELSEGTVINNTNTYGITKRLGESIVKESSIPEKLIIQLPKMIGPYVHMDNTAGSGFLTMTKNLLNDKEVVCFIPDMKYNNYLHVSELGVFIRHLLMQDKWKEHETVLVGARERLTMMRILQIMKEEMGSSSEIIARSNGTTPEVSLINIRRAENLGFSPCDAADMLKQFARELIHV